MPFFLPSLIPIPLDLTCGCSPRVWLGHETAALAARAGVQTKLEAVAATADAPISAATLTQTLSFDAFQGVAAAVWFFLWLSRLRHDNNGTCVSSLFTSIFAVVFS